MSQKKSYTIFDYDRTGVLDGQGNIVNHFGSQAVIEALKNWIISAPGDSIRDYELGGKVLRHLLKPMNSDDDTRIRDDIYDGIHRNFVPHIDIIDLKIVSNFQTRKRQIYIYFFVPLLNVLGTLDETIAVE